MHTDDDSTGWVPEQQEISALAMLAGSEDAANKAREKERKRREKLEAPKK